MIEYPARGVDQHRFVAWLEAQHEHTPGPAGAALGEALEEYRENLAEPAWIADELDLPWRQQIRLFVSDPQGADGSVRLLELATQVSPLLDDVHFDGPDPFDHGYMPFKAVGSPDVDPSASIEVVSLAAFLDGRAVRTDARAFPEGLFDMEAAVGLMNVLMRMRGGSERFLLLDGVGNDVAVAIGPEAALEDAVASGVLEPQADWAAAMRELLEIYRRMDRHRRERGP
jgi:hypothetical protein